MSDECDGPYYCPNCGKLVPYELLEDEHCDQCFTDSDEIVQFDCPNCGRKLDYEPEDGHCHMCKMYSESEIREASYDEEIEGNPEKKKIPSKKELERQGWAKRFLDDFKED